MPKLKSCSTCQTENAPGAKFCSNCGAELRDQAQFNTCSGCGAENNANAKYCASCGAELSGAPKKAAPKQSAAKRSGKKSGHRPRSKAPQAPPKKNFNNVIIAIVVVGAVLIYFAKSNNSAPQQSYTPTPSATIDLSAGNGALDNQVYQVASQFVCSCGSCPEEPLESCQCPAAEKERQFIREALQKGTPVNAVVAMVEQTYGKRKR